jgi:tagatose 1,6-diphosphate aldolase
VEFEVYLRQVELACRAGASGCAVGRAVWQEAVTMDAGMRMQFLRSEGRARLTRLEKTCTRYGKPIRDYYAADAPFDWYRNYQAEKS